MAELSPLQFAGPVPTDCYLQARRGAANCKPFYDWYNSRYVGGFTGGCASLQPGAATDECYRASLKIFNFAFSKPSPQTARGVAGDVFWNVAPLVVLAGGAYLGYRAGRWPGALVGALVAAVPAGALGFAGAFRGG